MKQKIILSLAGLKLALESSFPMKLSDTLSSFCTASDTEDYVLKIKETEELILPCREICGEDLLQNYYESNGFCYAAGKPGTAGVIVMTEYLRDFSRMTMYIKKNREAGLFESFDKVLQLFPLRSLLAGKDALMLHASQIAVNGKGILFTAPSGTGKTTQARLWKKLAGAEIVCNDRTLLRREKECFFTYGYPVDGSNPVCSTKRYPLGAIVVLRQSGENRIERLRPAKALKYLMEQTVADVWNPQQQEQLLKLWLQLLEHCPVYRLDCRPNGDAVVCLKEKLTESGVLQIDEY